MQQKQHSFAFLVHPRNLHDLFKKYPLLKYFPKKIVLRLLWLVPPIPVTNVYGLPTPDGRSLRGYLIAVPLTARQMLDEKERAQRKVIEAVHYAHKRGVTHLGLGALTSVVTAGGNDVANIIPNLCVTNGNALTAHMTFLGIQKVLLQRNIHTAHIALVGATGSIGSAVSQLLVKNNVCDTLYVVGRTPANIQTLETTLRAIPTTVQIQVVSLEYACAHSDIIVTATSAHGAVLNPETIKEHAVVYDITQPQNVPRSIENTRPDVTVIDGALVRVPNEIQWRFNLGTPKGVTFACMAETMLLTIHGYQGNFCLGHVTLDQVACIAKLADLSHFTLADFTSWGRPLQL